eukprot:CAMPEP_0201957796 /NCGR_PEP_ID=MMETSP0904-20121228/5110_1 /ASSEMBLY_ACC=CAM_ASM_000553 /TAXON_ID=420261 /ORGANISM="Thalassiosira antarctica, Strain CCMP982" /LENGTH=39 /DNA_ID= /DNA_START= /DNA_END= /DNA_ORIENTATION=
MAQGVGHLGTRDAHTTDHRSQITLFFLPETDAANMRKMA